MPRAISKVAPEWWDYTTLDEEVLDDAAGLTAEAVSPQEPYCRSLESPGNCIREQFGCCPRFLQSSPRVRRDGYYAVDR